MQLKNIYRFGGLSVRFLKVGACAIALPIAHIINLSLHLGCVPGDMKTTKAKPLYKNKSKTDPCNYRPVSILTVVSNILERVTYNQIESYIKMYFIHFNLVSGALSQS